MAPEADHPTHRGMMMAADEGTAWYGRFKGVTQHLRDQGHVCAFVMHRHFLRAPGVVEQLPEFRPANENLPW